MKTVRYFLFALTCLLNFTVLQAQPAYGQGQPQQPNRPQQANSKFCPCGCGCLAPCTCGCIEGKPCTCHHQH